MSDEQDKDWTGRMSEEEEEENAAGADSASLQAGANARLRAMMDQNFIEYASYVIKDRAIPDVDDGLKPVQRRILWTLHLLDNGMFHKAAGVIGDTMKFHPHGDQSIGGALVNLANKDLYIEKQGSFGSVILGTGAAAPRYIECRLAPIAREVLFNDDITEFVDSYDGRNREPVCLPSKLPNLLLMGADGVAVGTRTKILPHNFKELLEAQIAILNDEEFHLYPDFPQGGEMDVTAYEDGLGKVVIRAKIEIEGRNLVIREIPADTDTSRLMDSVETAVNKNKIKLSGIHDYSADTVNIQLIPQRGYAPEKCLSALYTYTDCQKSITCSSMVIRDNRPEKMSVSAILRRNTEKLVQYLKWELQIEAGKCLDKILARTLAQIFIQEGIYRRIEKCKSREDMFREVRSGLEKFKDEWLPIVRHLHETLDAGPRFMPMEKAAAERLAQLSEGIIPDSEIEYLVEIPIRRIAAFEINANREQIEALNKTLLAAERNLKRIKAYTIKYLQGLIDKYGSLFPRKTVIRLEGFEKIDKRQAALNNVRVGWDRKNCYIGTGVKCDEPVVCNEFDHLLCVERDGTYKIIGIPEKIYVDRLYELRKYDKTAVFGVVYSDKKTGRAWFKRTKIDKFITDKEYRICPEGTRLELITPRPNAVYEIKVDTPIKSRQTQQISLADAPLRSPKAGGSPISPRKLLKITFLRYLDGEDGPADSEQTLLTVPPDQKEPEPSAAPETGETPAAPETPETAEKQEKPRKTAPAEPKKPAPEPEKKAAGPEGTSPDEDEDWGIQPDLGF